MDLPERLHDDVSQPLCAPHAQRGTVGRPLLVEARSGDRVGEGAERAPAVHCGLSALGLHLAQDAGELRHLLVPQMELVGEEAERAADTEGARSEVARVGWRGPMVGPWALGISAPAATRTASGEGA